MTSRNAKKNDVFSKKIPSNPRYQNVKTRLDTGASASNYLNRIEEIKKNHRYRKDEIFKRMKVSTFAQLVLQVAEVCNLELDRLELDTARSDCGSVRAEDELPPGEDGSASERRLLQDVIRGVGEVEVGSGKSSPEIDTSMNHEEQKSGCNMPDLTSLPFLLLDIRDKDAYDECHIIGSLNYPASMLSRSVNYLSKEMLLFKNKPGKIIVVYDADEKICPNVATVLVQREIDNVIMLSGGLKVLNKKFPSCFLSGKVPSTCYSPKMDRKGNPKSPPNIVSNVGVDWYTPELLEKIQDNLDEVLLSNESSRLSSRLTSSRASKATSVASGTSSQATWR